MASILKVDEMQGVTNTNEMTIAASNVTVAGEGTATMRLQQGLIKVWFDIEQVGTHSLPDSFNCSSVTDISTGQSQVDFTSAMNNSDWAVSNNNGNSAQDWVHSKYLTANFGTGKCDWVIYDTSAGWTDGYGSAMITGDLA